jgi:hypothetical protein
MEITRATTYDEIPVFLGATGNLTQNLTDFNVTVKPNRWYELTYNVSGVGVAGCLAFIPTDFANKRIYLPGVSLTTSGIVYDVNFKTNSNPGNFTITAICTAGSFYLDNLTLKEINSGDIIANGRFTGGGDEGIKIDEKGNVNITQGNLTLNSLLTLKTITLPVCNSNLNYTIGANLTGIYYCNSSTWRPFSFGY